MAAQSLQPCDLVMKGGITSGVVYPPTILEISKHYRFRRIGGASAGAIAAAAAAAAEYGREESTPTVAAAARIVAEHNSKKGFEQLEEIKCYLSKDGNLRNLFQPSPGTKPLMNLVDALFPPTPPKQVERTQQTDSKLSMLQSLLHMLQFPVRLICIWAGSRYFPPLSWSTFWGLIIGSILFAFLPLAIFGFIALFTPEVARYLLIVKLLPLACGIIGAWFGLQIGGVIGAIMELPQNFYGICSGHSDGIPKVLTDWLSDVINQMAGKDKPLTFGELKNKTLRKGQPDEERVGIILRMVTSNLSQGQPYLLPSGLKGFLFKEDDMCKLFPSCVVKHMVDFAAKSPIIPNDKLPKGYHFLPDEDDLPVVVAMRMSLSFPILLSAIPLYTISAFDAQRIKNDPKTQLCEKDLQQNWFSDGGICNNFPIEFFDVWLPRWPTFGINLASMPAKAFENEHHQATPPANPSTVGPRQVDSKRLSKAHFSALHLAYPHEVASDAAVFLPKADAPQNPEWKDLQNSQSSLQRIGAFIWAIIGTGLFYHETMQANLPSYRERVVQIRLSDEEGGLNLNMPFETIGGIVKKGEQAGELIWNSKNNSQEFNLEYHQWVRFRVLMAKLEENFEQMGEALKDPKLNQLLMKPIDSYSHYPYSPPEDWGDEANARFQALQRLIACWQYMGPYLFRDGAPQPDTGLQVRPEL